MSVTVARTCACSTLYPRALRECAGRAGCGDADRLDRRRQGALRHLLARWHIHRNEVAFVPRAPRVARAASRWAYLRAASLSIQGCEAPSQACGSAAGADRV